VKPKRFCYACGTPLIQKYIEDRNRLFCPQCRNPVYENPLPATAAVVINEQEQILLVKRNVEPKIGQWCLPGGFVEMGESPEQGCLRELKEETGLDGEIENWNGNVLSQSPVYQWVIVMGYSVSNFRGNLKAGDDCSDARFFSLESMPPIAFRSHRQILKNSLNIKAKTRKKILHLNLKNSGCFGAYVITAGQHLEIAERACRAGARVLQYREKHVSRKEMMDTAKKIREITEQSNTLFIVNDFIDIALLVGADGVHLGQDDISISDARKITPPGFIIGRSTHSFQQAVDAEKEGADYIGSGPVFSTPTKEDYIPIGIDTVKQVIQAVGIPVVAIGGLNPGNIHHLQKIGVKNFAMVRAFQENTEAVVKKINR